MKSKSLIAIILLIFGAFISSAQDTFSIVAVDSVTGEVGSAGASCVDMINFPGYQDDFLGELFPNLGAINTQAWYHPTNQANARNRMNLGDTPSQIIQWLVDNDVSGQPQIRQYGIVAMVDGSPESAAHTGISTNNYKNHILGANYSIQGNILLGQEVLDSMESKFLAAPGDLACKLMAALQGAKMVGADTRCTSNGTSSLFAFVKVAQPTDLFGNPSFILSVRTSDGEGIEPIDTLQTLFDNVHDCFYVGLNKTDDFESNFNIFPNPASNKIKVENKSSDKYQLQLIDIRGNIIANSYLENEIEIDVSLLPLGIYILRLSNDQHSYITKVIKY